MLASHTLLSGTSEDESVPSPPPLTTSEKNIMMMVVGGDGDESRTPLTRARVTLIILHI